MSDFLPQVFTPNKPIVNLINNLNTSEINVGQNVKIVPNYVINHIQSREKELTEKIIFDRRVEESINRIEEYKNIVKRANTEREDRKGTNISLNV